MALFGLHIKYGGSEWDIKAAKKLERTLLARFGRDDVRSVMLPLDHVVSTSLARGVGIGTSVYDEVFPRLAKFCKSARELCEMAELIVRFVDTSFRIHGVDRSRAVFTALHHLSDIAGKAKSMTRVCTWMKDVTDHYPYGDYDEFYAVLAEAEGRLVTGISSNSSKSTLKKAQEARAEEFRQKHAERFQILAEEKQKRAEEERRVKQASLAEARPDKRQAEFRMTAQEIIRIAGKGTVVTGCVEAGSLRVGEGLEIECVDGTRMAVKCGGITRVTQIVEAVATAETGDKVRLLLCGPTADWLREGDVLLNLAFE